MALKRDIRSCFSAKGNESKRSRISVPEIVITATDIASQAEVKMSKEEFKKESFKRKTHQNVPEKVRKEFGRYGLIHWTKAAVDKYSKIYPNYDLNCTSVNTWKKKCKNNKDNTLVKKSGRPNLLSDELLQKTKDIVIGAHSAGTVISRRMVTATGTGATMFLASPCIYIVHYYPFQPSAF